MRITRAPRFLALILSCVMLLACVASGCGSSNAAQSGTSQSAAAQSTAQQPSAPLSPAAHSIVKRTYPTYVGTTAEDTLNQEFPLYFMDGIDDLPFVELNDWAELLYFIYTEERGDTGYELSISCENNVVTMERESGYSLAFDFGKRKLVYEDYDAFVHKSNDAALIDMVSESSTDDEGNALLIWRNTTDSFDRYGDVMTVDLDAYGIPMVAQDGGYYLPLQTLNDFTLLPSLVSFVFNGQALFMAYDEIFFDYKEGEYTEAADLYYKAPTADRSDALAEYSYNELCLALDTFYGLKTVHDIDSFRQLFWQIGYDEVLSGRSALDADNALKSFIDYYLDDLHSGFNEYSALAGLNKISGSTGMSNRKLDAHSDVYSAARDKAYPDGWLEYEEVGNTAYITFDSFESRYGASAYYAAKDEDEELSDTVAQIIDAHARITRENSPIENVVLDLSNNTGGAVDAAVVVLSWFLGDAPFSIKNMATGALSTAVYRADINLDHKFDEKDTVADKNLYCLISPVSFSCGNLVPAGLKSSQKVTLIGRTSGGGSCSVQPMTTAYGTVFQISSAMRMSFLKNGSFYDIDQGIEPDYYIDNIENYYDRAALTRFINGLF